jgi:hypothetical protein
MLTLMIKIVMVHVASKNYSFVITYLLEDEQELSLGMLIRLKLSIIFDASCLFLHHLPCVSLHFVAFLCDFQN